MDMTDTTMNMVMNMTAAMTMNMTSNMTMDTMANSTMDMGMDMGDTTTATDMTHGDHTAGMHSAGSSDAPFCISHMGHNVGGIQGHGMIMYMDGTYCVRSTLRATHSAYWTGLDWSSLYQNGRE
jgi:hypothetical protein